MTRDDWDDFDLTDVSRRRAFKLFGAASFAELASTAGGPTNGNGKGAKAAINVLPNPNFITNAWGETPLFDPGPMSIPLNEIIGDADDYEQDLDRLSRIANDFHEEDEIHFVSAFHYDDQVWGVYPGP